MNKCDLEVGVNAITFKQNLKAEQFLHVMDCDNTQQVTTRIVKEVSKDDKVRKKYTFDDSIKLDPYFQFYNVDTGLEDWEKSLRSVRSAHISRRPRKHDFFKTQLLDMVKESINLRIDPLIDRMKKVEKIFDDLPTLLAETGKRSSQRSGKVQQIPKSSTPKRKG